MWTITIDLIITVSVVAVVQVAHVALEEEEMVAEVTRLLLRKLA